MQVTRLDLDGTGSPLGLVGKILEAEPNLRIPVPIEELAHNLDISEIGELTTAGFDGALLTDTHRSVGGILVRRGLDRRRRRFTIGHELGHFLILTHQPAKPGQFLCSSGDMFKWSATEQNRAAQMEVEANRFSAGILIPPPHLRAFLRGTGDPDLSKAMSVHEHFDVSKEAGARAYATHQSEKIAIAVVHNGRILRIYRSPTFPKMCVDRGSAVPNLTSSVAGAAPGTISNIRYGRNELWLDSDWGVRLPSLYDQVMVQSDGFAMILLWCETAEEDEHDPDEGKTAKERYRDRQAARDPFDRR